MQFIDATTPKEAARRALGRMASVRAGVRARAAPHSDEAILQLVERVEREARYTAATESTCDLVTLVRCLGELRRALAARGLELPE